MSSRYIDRSTLPVSEPRHRKFIHFKAFTLSGDRYQRFRTMPIAGVGAPPSGFLLSSTFGRNRSGREDLGVNKRLIRQFASTLMVCFED